MYKTQNIEKVENCALGTWLRARPVAQGNATGTGSHGDINAVLEYQAYQECPPNTEAGIQQTKCSKEHNKTAGSIQ